MKKSNKRYIGVDLHSRSFEFCILVKQGRGKEDLAVDRGRFPLTPEGVQAFAHKLSIHDELAVEAVSTFKRFSELLHRFSEPARVVAVNTLQFKFILKGADITKNDRIDAMKLAIFLSRDMLPPSRIKHGDQWELYQLCVNRSTLVQQRTVWLNKLRALLRGLGIEGKTVINTEKALKELVGSIPEGHLERDQAELCARMIRQLNQETDVQREKIVARAAGMPGFDGLCSITGVGPLTASILLAVIGDISRFSSPRKLTAYLGLAPRTYSSSGKTTSGGISKRGDPMARTALVQASWVLVRFSDYYAVRYAKLKNRGKKPGQAIIKIADNLLYEIYRTLKQGRVYDDFKSYSWSAGN